MILPDSGSSLTSGIQTINVSDESGVIKIVTRKTKASPYAVASAYATSSIRAKSGGRRSLGVAAELARKGYRPDLRKASYPLFFMVIFSLEEEFLWISDAFSLEPTGFIIGRLGVDMFARSIGEDQPRRVIVAIGPRSNLAREPTHWRIHN